MAYDDREIKIWPPSDLLMQIGNDSSIENFKVSLEQLQYIIPLYVTEAGDTFGDLRNILDFGCGVGRFLFAMRPLLKPGQKLYGCDIDSTCASWAKQNIDFAEVYQNKLEPPLKYPDDHFDFIYALSVFTHLRLDMQFKWAWELYRILKPGGLALISTSAMGFMIRALAAKEYFPIKNVYIFNEDSLLAVFATDETKNLEGQREVAVIHGLPAARSVFSAFEMVKQIPISMLAGGQTVNLMRKREEGAVLQPLNAPYNFSGVRGKISAIKGLSEFIRMTFASGRHGCVKLALQFERDHYVGDRMELSYSVLGDRGVHHQGIAPMPFNTAFGRNHFIEFSLPFLKIDQPVSIEVAVKCLAPNLFQMDAPFTIHFVRSEPF